MNPLAELHVSEYGDAVVAAIVGEVDASNAGELAAGLRERLSNRSIRLVVDLSPTRYLDSAGINLLFNLGAELHAHQVALALVVEPGSSVERMLGLTGLDKAHATFPTLDAALARS